MQRHTVAEESQSISVQGTGEPERTRVLPETLRFTFSIVSVRERLSHGGLAAWRSARAAWIERIAVLRWNGRASALAALQLEHFRI